MQALHENGLIRIRQGYMRLTRSGMLVSNSILSNLFARTREVLKQAALSGGLKPQAVESSENSVAQSALHEDSPEIRPVRWPSA